MTAWSAKVLDEGDLRLGEESAFILCDDDRSDWDHRPVAFFWLAAAELAVRKPACTMGAARGAPYSGGLRRCPGRGTTARVRDRSAGDGAPIRRAGKRAPVDWERPPGCCPCWATMWIRRWASKRTTLPFHCFAQPRSALGDCLEDRLGVGRRAGDGPQNLGRGGLAARVPGSLRGSGPRAP